jgi:hypothetical protein
MSVVADQKGFTIVGPEPDKERTVPWEQTTSFTCQRPARLPDGSPATVLEVGLANGRVLELLLPVTRVPPSETVVVETELAVMAEQYGHDKSPRQPPRLAPLIGDLEIAPSVSKMPPSNSSPSHPSDQPVLGEKLDSAQFGTPRPEPREQVAALALNGSHSNGNSVRGSQLVIDAGVAPTPAVADPALDAPTVAAPSVPAPEAPLSEMPLSPPAVEDAPARVSVPAALPENPVSEEPVSEEPHSEEPVAADSGDAAHAEATERRENRLFKMLIALIGVVVIVLIAELVLILFVVNHNPSPKNQSVGAPITAIADVAHSTPA